MLREKNTRRSGSNFQTKETSEVPQIFHVQKVPNFFFFKGSNAKLNIPRNQNIINIYQKYSIALEEL